MKQKHQPMKALLFIVLIGIMVSFCASRNFLKVSYQLPTESDTLAGTRVSLTFKDIRASEAIVSKSARMALKGFSGHFALIVARENETDRLIGAFSLYSMVKEVFKQRLKNAGIEVAAEEIPGEPIIEIALKQFRLDLVDRKWMVNMSYQASLKKSQKVLAGETISGSAERLRVVGSKDAEKVIGELVTEVVNKLNLNKFFQQAGA